MSRAKKPAIPATRALSAALPNPRVGDPDKDTVFAAVGRALSEWEKLEGHMALIFEHLVSGDRISLPAIRAYGSVLTSRGRGEMISAAADAVFFLSPNAGLKKELDKLVETVGRFAGRRNEIAHGIVNGYYPDRKPFTSSRKPPEMKGYVLGPSEYSTNKTKLERRSLIDRAHRAPSYAYSSTEIAHYQSHFERLQREAVQFMAAFLLRDT